MTREAAVDVALREADRLTILASEARQLRLNELARALAESARDARTWALLQSQETRK